MSRSRPEAVQDAPSLCLILLTPVPHEFRLEDSQILGTWRYLVVYSVVSGGILVVCRWLFSSDSLLFGCLFGGIRVLLGHRFGCCWWRFLSTTPGGIRLPYSGGIREMHPPLCQSEPSFCCRFSVTEGGRTSQVPPEYGGQIPTTRVTTRGGNIPPRITPTWWPT